MKTQIAVIAFLFLPLTSQASFTGLTCLFQDGPNHGDFRRVAVDQDDVTKKFKVTTVSGIVLEDGTIEDRNTVTSSALMSCDVSPTNPLLVGCINAQTLESVTVTLAEYQSANMLSTEKLYIKTAKKIIVHVSLKNGESYFSREFDFLVSFCSPAP